MDYSPLRRPVTGPIERRPAHRAILPCVQLQDAMLFRLVVAATVHVHPRLGLATVSESIHVQRRPPRTVHTKRLTVINPLRRFEIHSRDIRRLVRPEFL